MPGLNQRGPMGQGPMTGRRMGRCTNFGASDRKEETIPDAGKSDNQPENFWGRGFGFRGGMGGRGRGGGRGMGFQNRFRGGSF